MSTVIVLDILCTPVSVNPHRALITALSILPYCTPFLYVQGPGPLSYGAPPRPSSSPAESYHVELSVFVAQFINQFLYYFLERPFSLQKSYTHCATCSPSVPSRLKVLIHPVFRHDSADLSSVPAQPSRLWPSLPPPPRERPVRLHESVPSPHLLRRHHHHRLYFRFMV